MRWLWTKNYFGTQGRDVCASCVGYGGLCCLPCWGEAVTGLTRQNLGAAPPVGGQEPQAQGDVLLSKLG